MTTSKPRAPVSSPFPLLPLRDGALLPGALLGLPVGRPKSVALLDEISEGDIIGVGVQRDPRTSDPGIADLIEIGTYARVRTIAKVRRGRYQVLVEGLSRFTLTGLSSSHPFWRVTGEPVSETTSDPDRAAAIAEHLVDKLRELGPALSDSMREVIERSEAGSSRDAGRLADAIAAGLGLPTEKLIQVLGAFDVTERVQLVHELLLEAEALAEIKGKIRNEVQKELGKTQREVLLRQQLEAIRRELGEGGDDSPSSSLRDKLAAVELPAEVRAHVDRELGRLEGMTAGQPEHHVIVKYLEFIAELPWAARAEVTGDIAEIERKLDADHYGLEEVKTRILEHLAVRAATGNGRGAILCLVGPPGVGKTSLARSIADATGRPLARVALGGVRDEADIRGHRRTYIGALPGRVLSALTRAGVKNPVMLLDEIDKLGQGWLGSPEAALLEVLDPEQNHTFTDHYLDLEFDLSEVLFLCTANTIDSLSAPLRDRLEIIRLDGYTTDDKAAIARAHLLPAALTEHGLAPDQVAIRDEALVAIVRDYTREAGVRQLAREIKKICRAVTLAIARGRDADAAPEPVVIDEPDLRGYLGKPRFFSDVAERTQIPGIATGLAWTPTGGDILFIESSRMRGKGRLQTTGQLGDVMQESARAALTYVRSNADALGIDPAALEDQDVHVHVPAGATPKDGPSAGVTITTALTSLLTGRRVRPDTAMTGECTLRGRVLPVGGIKAKVLAAHRAGLKRVILPAKNLRDLDDVPAAVRDELVFVFADEMREVIDAALEDAPSVGAWPAAAVTPGPAARAPGQTASA